ncbi:uncharacterized protein MELLADRAFT_105641 [Melampsora larici-populina 98AG31]|uniref:Uncharacterized protein n=1 Tax=Melampsora larici-populina (strain 98AG31 / pathotype 3-4-7) TaxID=747676 RepID=F4RIW0_MELLP|nr:uncharacterized protein MELLADRAFT_105641 [Melampsora larici-populina 98AG31]EGG07631.1 hypothetical protein MELLADRAFT_105641 [Melampsora larici-populina 98AG31]
MNVDFYPENIDERLESDHFLIAIVFIVTITLPIELTGLRLIVLNSQIFKRFNRSMQILLKLQIVSSYISIGELPNAKIFLNKMVSRSNKFSNIPEFKTLQDLLLNVKLESPDPDVKSNSIHVTAIPAIVDSLLHQNCEIKTEEDMIDTGANLYQIQNPTHSSKKEYDVSDNDEPALKTRSNSFADQDQSAIIDEDMSDTKPNLDHIQHPKRSARKRHATSDDENSRSPKKCLKSKSRSVSYAAIPETVILDDEPFPKPPHSSTTIDADLESRQDMEEAKYVISTNQTWPEPINKIDFDSLRKPKHLHKHRLTIINQLRWESEGVIVKPKLFADAFWKYKIDGITPLEKLGKGVREESRRTLDKYLEYCERYSIMALPFTKVKLYLFFIEDFHHLSLSTTRNYSRYLFYAVKVMRIMIPHLVGKSITIEELKASKLWIRWLGEREEYDRLRKSGNPSH